MERGGIGERSSSQNSNSGRLQRRNMSAHCPLGYQRQHSYVFYEKAKVTSLIQIRKTFDQSYVLYDLPPFVWIRLNWATPNPHLRSKQNIRVRSYEFVRIKASS